MIRFFFLLFLAVFSVFPQTNQHKFQLKLAAEFDVGFNKYSQLGFSPNGKYFFALVYGKKMQVWGTGSQKPLFIANGKFEYAQFSLDAKWIAVFSQKEGKILEAETGKVQAAIAGNKEEIRFLSWSPDNKKIAIGTKNFNVNIINIESGALVNSLTIHKKEKGFLKFDDAHVLYMSATFSPDGKKLLTNCRDSEVEYWDLESGKAIYILSNKPEFKTTLTGLKLSPAPIARAQISPDGKWIATTTYNETRLWNEQTGELVNFSPGFTFPRFSPNSNYLGIIGNQVSSRATDLINLASKRTESLERYAGDIVVWSPNSHMFITDRTLDEVIKNKATIWDAEKLKPKAEIKTYAKHCFDFVSTCISDWDVFSFSPDSQILMAENNKELKFFDPENGEMIYRSIESGSPASWCPNGELILAKAKAKGKIMLWDVIEN